jgi:hypothetical protein
VVVAVLLVVVGPNHDQQYCYHHAPTVKPEIATAVVELLMMGVRTPKTRWAVHTSKCQVINLRNCCIWLVDLSETVCGIYKKHKSVTCRKTTYKKHRYYEQHDPIQCNTTQSVIP